MATMGWALGIYLSAHPLPQAPLTTNPPNPQPYIVENFRNQLYHIAVEKK